MPAKIIAELIIETGTDFRGDLFEEVAEILCTKGQHYTSKLFHEMAIEYGVTVGKTKNMLPNKGDL